MRSTTTFGDLIGDLKRHAPQVKKQKVGNQIMTTVDGQVTSHSGGDDVSSYMFDHDSIEKLKKSLGLTDTDSIDAHSVKSGSTMLIELTKANNQHLAHILLNNQANPAIADTPHVNALGVPVGGKSAMQYAVEMGRWDILEDMVGHHVSESIMTQKAKSTSNETTPAPTPRADSKQNNEQKTDPQKSKSAAPSIKTKKIDRAKIPEAQLQAAVKTLKQKLRSAKNPDAKSVLSEEKITATSIDDLFSNMKELIAEAKKVFKAEESKLPAETSKAATTPKALNTTVNKTKSEEIDTQSTFDKITASYPSYSIIYNKIYQALLPKFVLDECNKQDALFVETLNQINQNPQDQKQDDYTAQYNQALKLHKQTNYVAQALSKDEETVQLTVLNTQNYCVIQSLYKDKLIVHSSAALLRDYFAPYSAPVFRSKLWSKLRRLLTFNTGRRYTSDAEKLYQDISTRSLDTVDSILAVYKLINDEIGRVRKFKHHKNINNDSINSSYVSRLCFMAYKIQATEAFRFNKEFSDEPEIYQGEYQKMQCELLRTHGFTPVEISRQIDERISAAINGRFELNEDGTVAVRVDPATHELVPLEIEAGFNSLVRKINSYNLQLSLPEVSKIRKQIAEARLTHMQVFTQNTSWVASELENAVKELYIKVDQCVLKIEKANRHETTLRFSTVECQKKTSHLVSGLEKAIKVFADYGDKSSCFWEDECRSVIQELAVNLQKLPRDNNQYVAALDLISNTKNYLIISGQLDPAKKSFFLKQPHELFSYFNFAVNAIRLDMHAPVPQPRVGLV